MLVVAAGSGPPEFLTQIAALVVAGAVIGYLCARLRIVPIVGFLLAGVLIGPNALGVVRAVRPAPAGPPTVVDTDRGVHFRASPESACVHAPVARPVVPQTPGCAECARAGDTCIHLRLCVTCGHVGCCDSSPGRHAAVHAREEDHPVMVSAEPGEDWGWCYLDEQTLTPSPGRMPA